MDISVQILAIKQRLQSSLYWSAVLYLFTHNKLLVSLFQRSRVAYHHQLLCLCCPDMCLSTTLSRKMVIELPVVARPSALFRSSSVSGLPESHYSKLVILAPRQLCHALLSSLFVVCAKLS